MKKDDFNKLPVEMQLHLLDSQHDLLKNVIYERTRIIPTVSSLSATMLTVATFNGNLIPLTDTVRFIISVFLFLVPFSLFILNSELKKAQHSIRNNITQYLGRDVSKEIKMTNSEKFILWYPDMAIGVLGVAIAMLIFMIWRYL